MNKVYQEIGGDISSEGIENFQISELKEFMDETTKRMKIEGLSANMRTLRYYLELRDDPEGKNLKNLFRNHIAEDYFMFSNAENGEEIDLIESIESLAEEDPTLKELIKKPDANKALGENSEPLRDSESSS